MLTSPAKSVIGDSIIDNQAVELGKSIKNSTHSWNGVLGHGEATIY